MLAPDQTPEGPVLVGIQYRARPGLEDQLMTALQQTKNSRRQLAQATRISGQADVTAASELRGPGQERPRPENLRMTNWSNCAYLVQMASGTGARNGAGVNSHGNTASRTLLVPNSLV